MYYIPFNPKKKVNFYFILALYRIAKYNPKAKRKNIVFFNSITDLSMQLKQVGFSVSPKTISLYLREKEYDCFFSIENNSITLNNDFENAKQRNLTGENLRFFTLTDNEAKILLTQYTEPQNTLLIKVYIHLKHFCSLSRVIDNTQEQILENIGYSSKSGKNCDSLSKIVERLRNLGLIQYETKKDNRGFFRNYYRLSAVV